MDRILFLSGDENAAPSYKDGLESLRQFKVVFAADNAEGLQLLKTTPISVLVMDIHSPGVDGLAFLAHMTQQHPRTPCIVVSADGKPWYKERSGQQELLYHLGKPFNLNMLVSAILVALNMRDEGQVRQGISMTSILPLIELEKETCRLEVKTSGQGRGYLYFDQGILFDAHFKDLRGEVAAREIASWRDIELRFDELPPRRTSKRVTVGIMDLSGASWSREAVREREPDQEVQPLELEGAPEPAMASAEPQADPFGGLFTVYRSQLRSIPGYQAVAVLDAGGRILASDAAHEDAWEARFTSLAEIFAGFDQALAKGGFAGCQAATVHLPGEILIIAGAGIGSGARIKTIGILASGGNWFFMKLCLEKMVAQLLQELPAGQKA